MDEAIEHLRKLLAAPVGTAVWADAFAEARAWYAMQLVEPERQVVLGTPDVPSNLTLDDDFPLPKATRKTAKDK